MVRISILYPNTPGSRFDFEYYVASHMPKSIRLLAAHPGFRGVTVERGVAGATPGSAAAYAALCHFSFDALASFIEAFTPHASELQGDIGNYTDVAPVIQVSDILISR